MIRGGFIGRIAAWAAPVGWRVRRARSSADPVEINDLGCCLMDVHGRPDLAEEAFTRAAEAGLDEAVYNLANSLVAQERKPEAVPVYHAAIARGQTDAWLNLALLLEDLGDREEARAAYARAEAEGDGGGPLGIAFMLCEDGLPAAAMEAAQRAVVLGSETAAAVVACWRWCDTHDPALEPELRRGADLFPAARADLAALLLATGRPEEGRRVLHHGVVQGEVESMVPLANLLADQSDFDQAEEIYHSAIQMNDRHARHNLAITLLDRGDVEAGIYHLRLAAAGGDHLSVAKLRELGER